MEPPRLPQPPAVERAMGIKCETVNCAWEESVPGRSWRSTMLFVGWLEVEWRNGDGRAGWEAAREDRFSRELSEILEDLNARSGERDGGCIS